MQLRFCFCSNMFYRIVLIFFLAEQEIHLTTNYIFTCNKKPCKIHLTLHESVRGEIEIMQSFESPCASFLLVAKNML